MNNKIEIILITLSIQLLWNPFCVTLSLVSMGPTESKHHL